MIKNLKRRNCPISIKLVPNGAQFLTFEMNANGESFCFSPSSVVGEQFGEFLSALYGLFLDDNGTEYFSRKYLSDEDHVIHTVITKVSWDNEGEDIDIVMSRKIVQNPDFENERIVIEFRCYDTILKKYDVNTKDLCYAVAKACTEALKTYGIYGYRHSTEHDFFKLHQLLYIKAFAIGAFEAIELLTEDGFVYRTSFEKEMELLLFDM